jgi:hypothetical protein
VNSHIKQKLSAIYYRDRPPEGGEYIPLLQKVIHVLENEEQKIRPHDDDDRPGGLVQLEKTLPVFIVPDLHARMELIIHVLFGGAASRPLAELLSEGRAQLVFLGDGFHAEIRALERWHNALNEFMTGYQSHADMDREMAESLGCMEMVMELKSAFPEAVHFLKGNHENIKNEYGEGNRPFGKFAFEGEMVLEYIKCFYSEEFLSLYYRFEKSLPLLAVGNRFLVSHAEPKTVFPRDSVINYRSDPDVVFGLTWTANDSAEEGSVAKMLRSYLETDNISGTHYFGGHRTVPERYLLRADGYYVQIHNPGKYLAALVDENGKFDPDHDILEYSGTIDDLLRG